MGFLASTRRRAGLAVPLGLALVASLVRPDARAASHAASGTSPEAEVTWGTGLAPTGRAQSVRALAVVGRAVYLGGEFTTMVPPGAGVDSTETQTRNHLAAFDVDEHSLLPWNPDVDGPVRALVVSADEGKIYVGGSFHHIGETPVSNLALVDLATGNVDPSFRPRVNGEVKGMALAGDRLYVGGNFETVGGPAGPESRPKLAALDPQTGALLPWEPPLLCPGRYTGHNGVPVPTDDPGDVLAVAVPDDGRPRLRRRNVPRLRRSGRPPHARRRHRAAAARPVPAGRPVLSLAVSPADGETVFGSAGGPGGRVYAFSPDKPRVPEWTTAVDGDAPGVAASDDTVYLMGHYDYAGPERALRRHLAAFDATDGTVDDWNPVANTPQGAFSAAVGAGHVFVGGQFTRINDRPQPGFAQFPLTPPSAPTTTSIRTIPTPTSPSTTATNPPSSTSSTTTTTTTTAPPTALPPTTCATTATTATTTTATTSPTSTSSTTTASMTAPSTPAHRRGSRDRAPN